MLLKRWRTAAAASVAVASLTAAALNIHIGESGTFASSVTQYGITWTFSESERVGQFASGDYWVQGPVTITSITPNSSGTGTSAINGWQVNPPLVDNHAPGETTPPQNGQSFDGAGPFWNASYQPSLPYTANGGESIVKAISRSGHGTSCDGSNPCLQAAAILTVLSSVPANDGATVFRPPYAGASKPLFTTANLDTQIAALPRLSSTATIDSDLPTMQEALDWVKRPDIGYHFEEVSAFHPVDNVLPAGQTNPYAPGLSAVYIDSVMRALIAKTGDNETTRRNIVIALAQRGIDIYGDRALGMHWYGAGGTNIGTMPQIAFAAWALNNQTIKDAITSAGRNDFAETGAVRLNVNNVPVWGHNRCDGSDCETPYWEAVAAGSTTVTTWDPYNVIDGGYVPSTTYQECCTSSALKGDRLMVHLIPGMSTVWDDQPTLDYVDRWVTTGLWTQPDPCAPLSQGGGNDPGSANCVLDPDLTGGSTFSSFSCQAGQQCGRFPTTHGTHANGTAGDWGKTFFQEKMWNEYGPV